MRINFCVLAIILLLIPFSAFSHEKHEKKIQYFTKIIEADSSNQEAYFMRGVQFQSHGDFDEARLDFFTVLSLKPDHKLVKLSLAKLYHENLKLDSALTYINDYISKTPESNKAYKCRAEIYHSLKKHELSIQDYQKSISLVDVPSIELFFSISENYKALSDIESARKTLHHAMTVLGPIIPIKQALIDLEVKNRQWDNAHALVDGIIAETNRKETWHVLKAECYMTEGKMEEAEEQYLQALKELAKLNPNRRNTDFTRELEKSIEIKLKLISN